MQRQIQKRSGLLVAAAVGGLSVMFGAAPLHAAIEPAEDGFDLFTTMNDWTGWSPNSPATAATAVTAATYDYDLDTINGAGNNPGNSGGSINVGGASAPGSLQLTVPTNLGLDLIGVLPGEAYNAAFMNLIDPGCTPAFQPPNFTSGATVAYSGTLLLTYSVPTIASGTFLQLGVNLAYSADGFYQPFFGPAVSDGLVNGLPTFTATIPYTITAGNLSSFAVAIQSNSDNVPTSNFYVDDLEVVPEPASLCGLGAFGSVLLLRRKRN